MKLGAGQLGKEIEQPMAVVNVGGIVTSTGPQHDRYPGTIVKDGRTRSETASRAIEAFGWLATRER